MTTASTSLHADLAAFVQAERELRWVRLRPATGTLLMDWVRANRRRLTAEIQAEQRARGDWELAERRARGTR